MQKWPTFYSQHDIKGINISQKSHKIYDKFNKEIKTYLNLLEKCGTVVNSTKLAASISCHIAKIEFHSPNSANTLQTDSKWINYFKEMRGNFSEVILKIVITWVRTIFSRNDFIFIHEGARMRIERSRSWSPLWN